jgi:Cu/Ag efflux protein CusF
MIKEKNMRKVISIGLVAGLPLLATAAFAATMSATGVIKVVDTKGDSITLTDGKRYILSEGVEAESLKAGEKVSIIFHTKGGKMIATAVKVSQ